MVHLTWFTLLVVGLPSVLVHLAAVALTKALQSYSRSRLEDYCDAHKHPAWLSEIGHLGERTEHAAEAIAVVSGLFIAALIGVVLERWTSPARLEFLDILTLVLAIAGYLAAGAVGKVFAEPLLVFFWPAAFVIRIIAWPFTAGADWLSHKIEGYTSDPETAPRPMSVEVEIESENGETSEEVEAEISDQAHDLLQRAIELSRTSVSEVMIPAAAVVSLPATVTAREAAAVFRKTGRSRIPIYGANQDDVRGILLGKDLWEKMVYCSEHESIIPADLVRKAYRVPDSSNAYEAIEGLRRNRTGMAIVFNEYGAVAGLVTLEDLIEELVGPIDDEHDEPPSVDSIRPVSNARFEVDASLPLHELNDRLGLHLPTEEDYQTLGGLVLHVLGRLPSKGEQFRYNGIALTVLSMGGRAVRQILIDLHPDDPALANGTPPQTDAREDGN